MTMTMRRMILGWLAMLAMLAPAVADARWSTRRPAESYKVASSTMTVVPDIAWNRWSHRDTSYTEKWTLDGLGLNELAFIGRLKDGKTLFKQPNRRYDPLPKFRSNMLPTDIVELFETSARIVLKSSMFETTTAEPATFAGQPGVRFDYKYTIQDEEVVRNGEAYAAIVNGRLYLMSFEAPAIYYFKRDRDRFRRLVETAQIIK